MIELEYLKLPRKPLRHILLKSMLYMGLGLVMLWMIWRFVEAMFGIKL